MRILLLAFGLFLSGCSTLGFGDFTDLDGNQSSSNSTVKPSGEISVTFTYQPLIGGKHQVYLAGDFNNWSENEIIMKEIDGIYKTNLYLKL